jgi:hypothetical protein
VVPAVDVLIVAGLHVPVIPLLDVSGKAGAVLVLTQWTDSSKCRCTCGVTDTEIDAVVAHCVASVGVNV